VSLPADRDVVATAAAMNPAMSWWIALRSRIAIQPGQRVLVLGATGADVTVSLCGPDAYEAFGEAAADVDIPALATEITAGTLTIDAVPLPLSDVEGAWNAPTAAGQRVVFVP
jgi:hypothetical protein